jgi:hypothetical protein
VELAWEKLERPKSWKPFFVMGMIVRTVVRDCGDGGDEGCGACFAAANAGLANTISKQDGGKNLFHANKCTTIPPSGRGLDRPGIKSRNGCADAAP